MIRAALLALMLAGCAIGEPMNARDAHDFAQGWSDAGLPTECDTSAPRVLVVDDALALCGPPGESCADLTRKLVIVGRKYNRRGWLAHEAIHVWAQFCMGFADPKHTNPRLWWPDGLLVGLEKQP